jgi:hypothetical protein
MSSTWSYKYACSTLQQLLGGSALPAADARRLQERAQAVFRSLSPYYPTYLGQRLTATHSLRFEAHLRRQLLAEVEVHSAPAAPSPATINLRLLDGGQFGLQQEMPQAELAQLTRTLAAAHP